MRNETVINLEHLFANDIDLKKNPADRFYLFSPMNQTKETHTQAVTMDNITA